DLAFLLMDFDQRGHRDEANLVLNRYLDLTGEDDGLAALPLFLALRAVIRAHVTATMAAHGWGAGEPEAAYAQARRYLDQSAAAPLRAGYAAIIDAVALRREERQSFAAVAAAAGVPFTGLWLDAPPETMLARIEARRADASDASAEVLALQLARNPGALDWIRL